VGRLTKYPDEFRRDAVALVRSSGRPIVWVAASLGINKNTLWNWCQNDARDQGRFRRFGERELNRRRSQRDFQFCARENDPVRPGGPFGRREGCAPAP
jgi:transposase-like protein